MNTVLIALTRETLQPSVAKIFDELLTDRELSDEQIRYLQQTIIDSGALAKTERMMNDLADESLHNLKQIEMDSNAKAMLEQLALKVINRDA